MAGVDDVVGVVRTEAERRAVREAGDVAVAGDRREDGAEAEEVLVGAIVALHRLVGGDDLGVHLERWS